MINDERTGITKNEIDLWCKLKYFRHEKFTKTFLRLKNKMKNCNIIDNYGLYLC